jgi:hypothetical protein
MRKIERRSESGYQLYSIRGKIDGTPIYRLSVNGEPQCKVLSLYVREFDTGEIYEITVMERRQRLLCEFLQDGDNISVDGIPRCNDVNNTCVLADSIQVSITA